jgi:uncharacterized membrane protein (UPF0127 family)
VELPDVISYFIYHNFLKDLLFIIFMEESIYLKFGKRKLLLNIKKQSFFEIGRGLLFYSREKAPILMYKSNNPKLDAIHSWFVNFPFLAIWLDKNNNILEIRRIDPWKIHANHDGNWNKLIEVPISKRYDDKIKLLVGIAKGLNREND